MSERPTPRCVLEAVGKTTEEPMNDFPSPEESKTAMAHAVVECDRKKIQANQRVRELLKEKGIVA